MAVGENELNWMWKDAEAAIDDVGTVEGWNAQAAANMAVAKSVLYAAELLDSRLRELVVLCEWVKEKLEAEEAKESAS